MDDQQIPENVGDVKPVSAVTVKELDELAQQIKAKEDEIDAHADAGKALNKELSTLMGKATAFLKELDREEYDSPLGKMKFVDKWSVKNPQTDADKKAFFEHLRERQIFDKYATVNNKSLNSLFKADWDAAKEKGEGMTFTMPGIEAPTVFNTLDFKAKKARKPKESAGE